MIPYSLFGHDGSGQILNEASPKSWGVGASSTLLTTAEDFCKFMIYTLAQSNSRNHLYDEMIQIHSPIKEDYGKGYGWEVVRNFA